MRFLADESCDYRVVRALRAAGHDVTAAIDVRPGDDDAAIVDMALRERRIVITEDRDFGQLFYAAGQPTAGVILLRFPSAERSTLPSLVVKLVAEHEEKLGRSFVVLQPGRIRFSK